MHPGGNERSPRFTTTNSSAKRQPASRMFSDLNICDRLAFIAVLGGVFEHSPWVADETWKRRPFRDPEHLHEEMCKTVQMAPPAKKLELICAHPDLGGRLALEQRLTAASAHEQASAGLNQLSAEQMKRLQELNTAYLKRCGFPFVICARHSDPETILRAMETRVLNPVLQEFHTALAEIDKIAWLRIKDLLGMS